MGRPRSEAGEQDASLEVVDSPFQPDEVGVGERHDLFGEQGVVDQRRPRQLQRPFGRQQECRGRPGTAPDAAQCISKSGVGGKHAVLESAGQLLLLERQRAVLVGDLAVFVRVKQLLVVGSAEAARVLTPAGERGKVLALPLFHASCGEVQDLDGVPTS